MKIKDSIANNDALADEQRNNEKRRGGDETWGDHTPIDPNYFVMLSAEEVSDMTRLSPRTIRREVYNGAFPEPKQLSRGRKLWRKSEVLQFLAGRRNWPGF